MFGMTQKIRIAILLTLLNGCALVNRQMPSDLATRDSVDFEENTSEPLSMNTHSNRTYPSEEHTEIQQGLQLGELVIGMSMRHVVTLWGHPKDIETSGDFSRGNQKWVYLEDLWSHSNRGPLRVVYFEEGRVVGWKTGL